MSTVNAGASAGWPQLVEAQKGLLGRIHDAEGELERIECLDDEQRAEIHTILQALKHDGESQATILTRLGGEVGRV